MILGVCLHKIMLLSVMLVCVSQVAGHIDLGAISFFPLTLGGGRILCGKQVTKGKLSLFFASNLALKIIFTLEKIYSRTNKQQDRTEQVSYKS